MATTNQPLDLAAPPADTRLRGRGLVFLRLAWAAFALFYFGSFLAALPLTLSQRLGNAQQSLGWSQVDTSTALAQLGLSYEAFITYDTASNILLSLIFFGLGCFIFIRKSDDWVAILFSIFFITFLGSGVRYLGQSNPAWRIPLLLSDILGSIGLITLILFPDGRFVPRWMRWVALGFAGFQGWRFFQPEQYQQIAFLVVLPVLFCVILSQIYRYLRVSTPTQRQQTKWVVFGLAAGFTPLLVYLLVYLSNPQFNQPSAQSMAMFLIGNVLWSLALVSLVLSFTFAILRSRLWDIDVIIRRTLVYGALTLILGLVYFSSVVVLQNLFQLITGQHQPPISTVLSTLAIAALFTPLRQRIQNNIDQRFFRRNYDAQKILERFTARVRDEVQFDPLTSHLQEALQEAMQPEQLSLWIIKIHNDPS